MNDYKDMLLDAMTQGATLEDVMKGISEAANAIQQEQANATKYDIYNQQVWKSFGDNTNGIIGRVIHAEKISAEDMAIVLTHFICQNTPGYTAALAKEDANPIKVYTSLLKSQLSAAKVLADHQDDSDEEKAKAMVNHMFDDLIGSLLKDLPSEPSRFLLSPEGMQAAAGRHFQPSATSDEQKLKDFFSRTGL